MRYMMFFLLMMVMSLGYSQTQSSQVNPPLQRQAYTLQQQYKNLKADIDVIDGFRMVKIFTMDRLWAGVEDTLAIQKAKLVEFYRITCDQKKELQRLGETLAASEKAQGELLSRVDSISVLGIPFSKSGFVATVTVLFLALLAGMGILAFVTHVSNRNTRELRKLNDSLYQEFDTYKRHAVEKEVKILRELQDYRNKMAELRMA